MLKNLFSKSIDGASPEGRARERHRRVALTAAASALSRGIQITTSLVSIPLTVKYLGAERFGLWMTVSALIAILGFADLGMGNGLLNAVAGAHGREDREEAAAAISSAFFLLFAVSLTLAVVFWAVYPIIGWPAIFNVKSAKAAGEAGPAVAVFVASFLLGLPLGIVQRTQLGYQEGLESNLWAAAGNLLGFIGLLVALGLHAGLPGLMLGVLLGPVIALAANGWFFFFRQRPWLRPRWPNVSARAAKALLRTGFLFFALQVAAALCYQSPNFVIAQMLGASAVTQYAVPLRLFSVAPIFLGFVLAPLWPAYGEAIARGDHSWVTKTLKRSILMGLVVNVPIAAVLVLFGRNLIQLWVGSAVAPALPLLLGLGAWAVLTSFGGPLAMFLNGANVVAFQVVCALLMGISGLTLSIVMVGHIGVAGVVFATVIAQVAFNFVPIAVFVPRLLASMARK
ncbi:MAG: oligosaccharide flippase family protein [Thermoanaerobaculales bacterium]